MSTEPDTTNPTATSDPAERFADRLRRSTLVGYRAEVLDGARVLVCGVGALGQNTVQDLALSGVWDIRIVDADRFEEHNLTRSPLQARGPRSRQDPSKAEVVAHEAAAIATHPEARISWADAWVEDLGAAVFEDVDVLVGCVDALASRRYLNRMSLVHGIPHVTAGFSGAELSLGVYPRQDPDQACWTCGAVPIDDPFSCRARAASTPVPAIQTAAAVLGGLQAEAVIGLLHGWEDQPRRAFLNIRDLSSYSLEAEADPACRQAHRYESHPVPTECTPEHTLEELLAVSSMKTATVHLDDPWLREVNCPACERLVRVEGPLRRWRMNQRCRDCGGPWTPATGDGQIPETISLIEPGSPYRDLPLRQLGFAPGDRVNCWLDGQAYRLQLRGGVAGFNLVTGVIPGDQAGDPAGQ